MAIDHITPEPLSAPDLDNADLLRFAVLRGDTGAALELEDEELLYLVRVKGDSATELEKALAARLDEYIAHYAPLGDEMYLDLEEERDLL